MKNIQTFESFLNEKETLNEETSFKDYETAINRHDWYYSMSDDTRSYDKGKKEEADLRNIYKDLSDADKKKAFDEFEKLTKKNYPNSTHKVQFKDFTGI